MELWREHLPGSVVAIGNAPTALFRLLETLTDAPALRPAAILAFPVGFVGAAESKLALVEAGLGVPFVTLLGRRGRKRHGGGGGERSLRSTGSIMTVWLDCVATRMPATASGPGVR